MGSGSPHFETGRRIVRRIDCHMHVRGADVNWGWDHNDRIIEAADALGIDQLAVSIPVMRGMPEYATIRRCNDDVIAAMKQYPDRLLGYCYIVPGHSESQDEISRCFDAGMIGIKLYNQYKICDPVVYPVLERAIEEAVPVLEHAGRPTTRDFHDQQPNISDASHFVEAATRYPECMLIEAHIGGGGDWEWSIKQLRPILYNHFSALSGPRSSKVLAPVITFSNICCKRSSASGLFFVLFIKNPNNSFL